MTWTGTGDLERSHNPFHFHFPDLIVNAQFHGIPAPSLPIERTPRPTTATAKTTPKTRASSSSGCGMGKVDFACKSGDPASLSRGRDRACASHTISILRRARLQTASVSETRTSTRTSWS